MAETSPLINLDLVNQIYKVINAQIAERVYNPQYYSEAQLGTSSYRYKNAYLEALDVKNGTNIGGNATISGDAIVNGRVTSAGGFDGSLITIGSNNYISFKRYQTASSPTPTSATYTLEETTLSNDNTKIPTSKAVYTVIGNLETLLANI